MAITPADKPKYLYLTIYDDPEAAPEDHGSIPPPTMQGGSRAR